MNLKNQIILEDYRKERDDFVRLGDIVHEILVKMIKDAHIKVLSIDHRVKTEQSLAGKLLRKEDRYRCLDDVTDVLGTRIICFFADEVDKIGKLLEENFIIDWENVTDKRALIQADTFGYLSLHYVCSLKEDGGYPKELLGRKFEVQIKTTLQHTWSVINHDLGYKSQFGVPRAVRRNFSRIAGLLELADDEFVRIRKDMLSYNEDIKEKIANNCADNIPLDAISLREFVQNNKVMQSFLKDLATLCGAELDYIDPQSYLELLSFLGKKTLGDLQDMLSEDRDIAYRLACRSLPNTHLDILSTSVGLRFLTRAELVLHHSEEEAVSFFKIALGNEERAKKQAHFLYDSYHKMQEGKDVSTQ